MGLDLTDFEKNAREAVKAFWETRELAKQKQELAGKLDQGERAGVTAGKNMDGFVNLVCDLVTANGLKPDTIQLKRRVLTLPGYFRPTKLWDLLVIHEGRLIAVLEFKSQVGPSFGNNCNNRAEEAVGTALDLNTAFREGAFGDQPRPFRGWLMLLEDVAASRKPVGDKSPHFPVFPEFKDASYADRYHILCKKMMQEQLYDSAALLLSSRESSQDGAFSELDEMTSLKTFALELAAHIAAEAARCS